MDAQVSAANEIVFFSFHKSNFSLVLVKNELFAKHIISLNKNAAGIKN